MSTRLLDVPFSIREPSRNCPELLFFLIEGKVGPKRGRTEMRQIRQKRVGWLQFPI